MGQALEHGELGRAARLRIVRQRLRTREALRNVGGVENFRQQSGVDDLGRDIIGRFGVELGVVARKIARAAGDREGLVARDAKLV